ncbi:MAG: hypothetical protein OXD29_14275, partial [Roseovarius sp.]|nr:hypothetical protein [Roseovarius sp.]
FAYFVVLKPHYTTERPQGPGKLQKKCPIWATDSLDIMILQVAHIIDINVKFINTVIDRTQL